MLDLIARRENDNGRCIASFTQFAQYVDAVSMRQTEVEKHHVEGGTLQRGGGAFAIAHPINGKSVLAKGSLQALRDHNVVLNEQHTHSAVRRLPISGSSA